MIETIIVSVCFGGLGYILLVGMIVLLVKDKIES
jgi:hypothetical protein